MNGAEDTPADTVCELGDNVSALATDATATEAVADARPVAAAVMIVVPELEPAWGV